MAKKDRKSKKNIFITLGIIFGAITAFLVWFFYVGSPKEMISVADQLKTDPDWELVSEGIQPPRTVCIDGDCPSLSRQWETDHTLSRDEFAALLQKSGWNLTIYGDCLPKTNAFGSNISVCSAKGNIGKYRVVVGISASNPPKESRIGLSISEN